MSINGALQIFNSQKFQSQKDVGLGRLKHWKHDEINRSLLIRLLSRVSEWLLVRELHTTDGLILIFVGLYCQIIKETLAYVALLTLPFLEFQSWQRKLILTRSLAYFNINL